VPWLITQKESQAAGVPIETFLLPAVKRGLPVTDGLKKLLLEMMTLSF
jgi:hypothetical protein